MKKLLEYQKANSTPILADEFDETPENKSADKKKNKRNSNEAQIYRGNLGFCYIDMSLVNLCGIPSLWMDPRQLIRAKVRIPDGDHEIKEPYIKPFQKNLLKKHYKIYSLLRFHKIFENEKYFGKMMGTMNHHQPLNIFSDLYQFSIETLKENTKFHQQQMKLVQKNQVDVVESRGLPRDKNLLLHLIQGSKDSIMLDIPRATDTEPAYFKLINSEAKILKQILMSQNIQQTDQNDWNLLWTSVTLQQRP